MNLQYSLIKLGFSERDAEIYIALIKLGEAPVGLLINQTGLHRELVYGSLRRLREQGFVRTIEKHKVHHFVAENPKILVQQAKANIKLATQAARELKKTYKSPQVVVRVYEGQDGYEEIQKDIQQSLKNNQDYYVIGAAGAPWYDITRPYIKTYRKKSLKRGIHAKMVTFPNEVKGIIESELPGFAKLRILPQTFAVPSSTKIYGDKIILQIFGEQPLAIMVQSQAVAKTYKKYFESLWQIAKPLK